ncbi:MAG TPA: cupin domain-containing protein, partial [Candidatus Limnocylindria bacterium]|nr:cupin domain-containing protein [Candidatus Limnocylindria bacterium]
MPTPPALDPRTVPERTGSTYPEPFRSSVGWAAKRALGSELGLTHFGVNLVRLGPGEWSSLRHWHTHEDEFVYVLEGELTLVTDAGEQRLGAGLAAGFPAGTPDGHQLINRSGAPALYLEAGDRSVEDLVTYSDVDLVFS